MRFTDRAAFVAFMTADQPARPANIANIVAINQGHRPLSMALPESRPLGAADVERLQAAGHVVIDARRSADFSAGHVPGSLNVQLASPEFEQRVGWVAPPDAPLLLVLERDDQAPVAMKALAFVGLDGRVAGHLAGGAPAWVGSGRVLDRIPEIDVAELHARLRAASPPTVLDVREASEFATGHVPGARQASYRGLAARAGELRRNGGAPLAVVCHSGGRSSTAASILRRAGLQDVVNVSGGMQAWMAAGLPVEEGIGCSGES